MFNLELYENMSVARNSPRGLVAVSVFVQERKEKYPMDQYRGFNWLRCRYHLDIKKNVLKINHKKNIDQKDYKKGYETLFYILSIDEGESQISQ